MSDIVLTQIENLAPFSDSPLTGSVYCPVSKNGVTSKIKLFPITSEVIQPGTILGSSIQNGGITSSQLADNSVTSTKLAPGVITSSSIAAGAITSSLIAQGSITSVNIGPSSITTKALQDGAVTQSKLASGSVTTLAIAPGSVTELSLATSSVGTPQLVDGAVTSSKIGNGAIQNQNYAAGSITGDKIAASTITVANLASNAFSGTLIIPGTIAEAQFAAGAVNTAAIADGSVTVPKLTSDCISYVRNANYGYYSGSTPGTGTLLNYPWIRTNSDGSFDAVYTYVVAYSTWLTKMPIKYGTIIMYDGTGAIGLGWEIMDLGGYIPIGANGSGNTSCGLGSTGGTSGNSLTISVNQLPSHNHSWTAPASINAVGGSSYSAMANTGPGGPNTNQTSFTGGGYPINITPQVYGVYFLKFTGTGCTVVTEGGVTEVYRAWNQPA